MVVTISVILNVVLAIALGIAVLRAKARMIEEKAATFAGCLGAITDGIARDNLEDRAKITALGLSAMTSNLDHEEVSWRLVRAGFMRTLRGELALADVGGEHVRELTLRALAQGKDREAEAEKVWLYIDGALDHREGYEEEPRERFGDQGLSRAQYLYEGDILGFYRARVEKNPPKLFG
ncbi:MAG: hypothetical protein Q8N19_06505 [Phenylobacterium sp.]|uniref:hypothetical protein n=1 Tax=Phenylobacterium sp. TaxID=1871053 RepID=UPI0027364B27|nr:hypothetical protein [Phenylobacterium sp.]MDP3116751.1 hypothetical protein [Phenylobacterium sp.]